MVGWRVGVVSWDFFEGYFSVFVGDGEGEIGDVPVVDFESGLAGAFGYF